MEESNIEKFYLIVEQTVITTCVIVKAKSMTQARIFRLHPKNREEYGSVSVNSVVGVGEFETHDEAAYRSRKELYGSRQYLDDGKQSFPTEVNTFADEWEQFNNDAEEVLRGV